MTLHSFSRAALALTLSLAASCSDTTSPRFNVDAEAPTDKGVITGPCTLPNIMCGQRCVDPAEDISNCGGCDRSCGAGRVCVRGMCDNQCPTSPVRQTRCETRCSDTNVDRANCGACGNVCPEGQVCSAGSCQIECGPRYTSCISAPTTPDAGVRDSGTRDVGSSDLGASDLGVSDVAVDTGTRDTGTRDTATSDVDTSDSEATDASTRDATASDATTDTTSSTGPAVRCADLQVDDQHCGACGNACPLGFACIGGACELRCPSGQTICDGRCINLMTSQTDCGSCGTRCTGLQRCTNGSCTGMTCPTGTMDCSGTCADLTNSVAHCGMCGNACPSPQFCRAGRCVLECPAMRTACGMQCIDLQTDRANCGMCGNACPVGQVCTAGMCRLTCPMGTMACTNRCVDLSSDRLNCGACGTACGPGQLCAGGTCAPRCADIQTNCLGVCVNTAVDPNNCGACGVMCGPGYACSGGFCRALVGTDIAGCASPSVQCGPVCSDIRNDNENCGRCGNRCTADRVCATGMCLAPCAAGQNRCGATCTNTLGDRTNCGRCGNVCATALSCVSGMCAMEATFRVDSLNTTMAMCRVVEHNTEGGDDRGGIAVSSTQVFYTGDIATIRASAADLSGLVSVGMGPPPQLDALVHDLASGEVYVLLNAMGAQPATFFSGAFTVTQLGVVNGATGALTATRIPLSTPVNVAYNSGIFSGRGRAYIHTGPLTTPAPATAGNWVQIRLPSGTVTTLRTNIAAPAHTICESWAYWGIAEFFDSAPSVVFAVNSTNISRYRITDGVLTPLVTLTGLGLSDTCSITVSPTRNRWYFHYEGSGFAGGTAETLGSCPATMSTP